jgi:hypothetical protein
MFPSFARELHSAPDINDACGLRRPKRRKPKCRLATSHPWIQSIDAARSRVEKSKRSDGTNPRIGVAETSSTSLFGLRRAI